jgi:hypothetical protein
MGLNLSLKGQRIVPKITQKREIKCERTENKSLQSIYTLARLSSSSRVRRSMTGSGPTIMDFMQCVNFKSRLDREREMIRRKIRSSSLYHKPSFSKNSGFSIYNTNGDMSKVSCISKNIKIGEFKDEMTRKSAKSPLFLGDEQDSEDTSEKSILCIGSKYLDVSLNTTIAKSFSTSSLCVLNNEIMEEKQTESDFEKAITQSHLSPFVLASTPKNDQDETLKRKDHNRIKKSTHIYAVGLNVGKYCDAQKTEVALDLDLNNSTQPKAPDHNTTSSKAKKSGTKKKSSSHSKKLEKKSSPKTTATKKSIS